MIVTAIAKHLAKLANTSPTKIICGAVISIATSVAVNTIANDITMAHIVSQKTASLKDIANNAERVAKRMTETDDEDIEVEVDVVEENK